MQVPLEQVCPAVHARPHEPQLVGSVSVLAQPEAHMICGEGQITPHAPAWQVWPLGQRLLQRPQWALSDCGSTQMSLHMSRGEVHDARAMQVPFTHACPEAQRLLQRPQCSVDPRGSTHDPPHKSNGALHVSGVSVGGTGTSTGGTLVSVGGTLVSVGGTLVSIGAGGVSVAVESVPLSSVGVMVLLPPRAEHAARQNSPTAQNRVLIRMIARLVK